MQQMLLTQGKQAPSTMRSSESQHFEMQTKEPETEADGIQGREPGKQKPPAPLLPTVLGLQPGENNLETIGWAAALINKLFIVRKWLGQRADINLKLKAYRVKSNTC